MGDANGDKGRIEYSGGLGFYIVNGLARLVGAAIAAALCLRSLDELFNQFFLCICGLVALQSLLAITWSKGFRIDRSSGMLETWEGSIFAWTRRRSLAGRTKARFTGRIVHDGWVARAVFMVSLEGASGSSVELALLGDAGVAGRLAAGVAQMLDLPLQAGNEAKADVPPAAFGLGPSPLDNPFSKTAASTDDSSGPMEAAAPPPRVGWNVRQIPLDFGSAEGPTNDPFGLTGSRP